MVRSLTASDVDSDAGLDLSEPDHTALSQRGQPHDLQIPARFALDRSIHPFVDSTDSREPP